MKKFILKATTLVLLLGANIFAKAIGSISNSNWETLHLYHGENQRGGPFAFNDTYAEFEFGGRYEWLDLYGYIDFLDVLNSEASDKHKDNNYFVDIEPRINYRYVFYNFF